MGIARGMARLLLAEAQKRPFSGSVLQLGRQDIYFNRAQLDEWAGWHGLTLGGNTETDGPIDDAGFFRALGFSCIHSLDIRPEQNSDYFIHDLNREIPGNLRGFYDLVFDGGTMEHVFDSVAVLKNIHRLLKVGGRVVHGSPCNNHGFDEGYHMYSPSFFWDFYVANQYRIDTCYIVEQRGVSRKGLRSEEWNIYLYPGPQSWKYVPVKSYREPLSTFLVATKLGDFVDVVLPLQHGAKIPNRAKKKALKEEARRIKRLHRRSQPQGTLQRLKARMASPLLFFWTKRRKEKTKRLIKPEPIAKY